jgi:glycosyltransferase involved in cell wall biosynthesis
MRDRAARAAPPDSGPAITVVLPTHDGSAFVRESVESVLAQDMADFELIVCDDGSRDGTWTMLQAYAADARCRLYRHEGNRGLFPTLNRLVRAARSRWVHLWSQDDRMLPQCLRRTRAFADAHPEVGMIYSGVHGIDEGGRRLPAGSTDRTPDVVAPLLAARIMFYFGSIAGNIANVTVRKDAFDALGGFREDLVLSGDYEYWTRVSERWPIGFQREPLIELRAHRGQLSRQRRSGAQFIRENREIYDRLLLRLPEAERARARRYRRWVLDVRQFHQAVRCALAGDVRLGLDVIAMLRADTALLPLAARWLLSANGRRPAPPALDTEPRAIG